MSKRKHTFNKKDILDSHNYISEIFGIYPPNIITYSNKKVLFYFGLEEGLMSWGAVDKRKLKKEILRRKHNKSKKLNTLGTIEFINCDFTLSNTPQPDDSVLCLNRGGYVK